MKITVYVWIVETMFKMQEIFKIQEIDPLHYPEFEMMCNDHQTSKPHLLDLQVEFMFPEIKDDLHMLSDNFAIDNSISSESNVWEKNCA